MPTIIITAEWGQHEQAVALGVEGLVEKPIDVPIFLEMIRDLLAETPEARLDRICGREEYCRLVGRQIGPLLKLMEQRRTVPFKLSTALQSALQTQPATADAGESGGNFNFERKAFAPARKRNDANVMT